MIVYSDDGQFETRAHCWRGSGISSQHGTDGQISHSGILDRIVCYGGRGNALFASLSHKMSVGAIGLRASMETKLEVLFQW